MGRPRMIAVRVGAASAIVLGLVVLVGWWLDLAALKSVVVGWSTMKPNTAVCFVLSGLALGFLAWPPPAPWAARVPAWLGTGVASIGFLTLAQYVTGWDLRLDRALLPDYETARATRWPGRMGANTAAAFWLTGMALTGVPARGAAARRIAELAAIVVVLIGFVGFLAWIYRVTPDSAVTSYTIEMAVHTAGGLLLVAAGLLAAVPDGRFIRLVTGDGPGSGMIRVLLPVVLVIPPVAGWLLARGTRVDLITPEFGILLLVATSTSLLGLALFRAGDSINHRDVERTRAEAQARAVIEAAPAGIVTVDRAGRIVFVNREAERLFGYGRAELIGEPVEVLVPERLRGTHQAERRGFLERPQARPMGAGRELFGRRKDGSEVPVEIGLRPVETAEGQLVLASVVDITERRRAADALRETATRLRALMQHATDGIAVLTADGVSLEVNPAMAAIVGRPAAELVGRHFSELANPATLAQRREEFRGVLQDGSVRITRAAVARPDGREVLVDGSLTRVEVGPERLILVILRDVTQEQSLEQQLRQAQKMEAVGRLAGGVAHDFNNVLTAIFGYADLIAEEFPPDSPVRDDLGEIRKAALRAATLTRQLLAFSRLQVLEPVVLNLNELVGDIDKMLTRVLGENIALRQSLAPDLGNVRADPGSLHQVLMNLVVNARDAMPHGGEVRIESANVELGEAHTGDEQPVTPGAYVRLVVTDTGTGMDPHTLAHVFEPFFTTKERGKGTGLGLSTVYGIVQQSGGYILVDSKQGRGTTFTIYLPRVAEPVAPSLAPLHPDAAVTGDETILVAEDEDSLRPLTRGMLERLGYRVLAAENAAAALAAARAHAGEIHVLITDVVMPGASGRELAQQLARERPATRVLYISGYTEEVITRDGVLEPGLMFLQKPFTPAALARKVREVLDRAPGDGGRAPGGPASGAAGRDV